MTTSQLKKTKELIIKYTDVGIKANGHLPFTLKTNYDPIQKDGKAELCAFISVVILLQELESRNWLMRILLFRRIKFYNEINYYLYDQVSKKENNN